MANLPLNFAMIAGGGVLLTAGITGSSLASVLKGHPDNTRATNASSPAAPASSAPGSAPSVAGAAGGGLGQAGAGLTSAGGALNKSQIEALWVKYGGNPSKASLAASIALAESAGNPNATNNNANGSTDRGLFQINTVHGAQSTYNLADNVKAAISISGNGSDFSPWVTYQTGANRKYL